MKLWYNKPADVWVEALPVGNGRLGAMVYGDPYDEVIQLNENTVWGGQPNRNDNPEAKNTLPEVRKLIFEGKNEEAQALINESFFKGPNGMPYQTVGNLKLQFPEEETYSDYYRELDIERAVTTTRYKKRGVNYETSVFSSYPDQVLIVHITADKLGSVSFSASMDRPSSEYELSSNNSNQLKLSGVTSDHEGVKGAVKFEAQIEITTKGGALSEKNNSLHITNANEATIYISIGTNFKNYNDITGNAAEVATMYLTKAVKKNYDEILNHHIKDYQHFFNRVKLDLGTSKAVNKPTDLRIKEFAEGNDPQLVALYFQFGRFLLISSSRTGGQPANLQGIWNDQLFPAWDSKYTININTEMNYWPSETTNLTELNEPLIKMVHELSQSGKQTAKDMYGAQGWVTHHNTDIWRITGPVDGAFWGMWPMGSAWLSQHLLDKYDYSGDVAYLNSVYPVLKEASKFYIDFLTEEPENNWLVVAPSVSPENAPKIHKETSVVAGATIDNQLLFDLFTKTISAATILDTDTEFRRIVKEKLDRLPPMQIGEWGQLQEWMHDWDDPQDNHRHVSHLYGLYPSNQISPYSTPQLFEAARTSLVARGDESTGWSMGWKINLWARLLDGNHAFKLIQDQLTPSIQSIGEKGGTYPNLFDAHPPFQIDGNFGCTAGISEMLMQSHDGAIHILPALPDTWDTGNISGIRARGGFETDIEWEENKPTRVIIRSSLGGQCRVRSYHQLTGKNLVEARGKNKNPFYQIPEITEPIISTSAELKAPNLKKVYEYDLVTKKGETYILTAK